MRAQGASFIQSFIQTVRSSLGWIYFSGFVFLVGIVCGFIVSWVNPDLSREFFRSWGQEVQKLVSGSGLVTSLNIFERNGLIMIFSIMFGFLGLVPALVAFGNGMVFGMIFGFRDIYSNLSLLKIVFLILPHGVIEIFATIVGLGLSLKTGVHWIMVKKNKRKTFVEDAQTLAHSAVVVLGLLLIAALVEGMVTPALACLVVRVCF